MSAVRNWNWSVDDRIALRNRLDVPWALGTVTGINPAGLLVIRMDDPGCVSIRHPDDVRVVPAEQVPIDEQHWVPQKTRDQLMRVEAAERLRAAAGHVVVPPNRRLADVLAAISCPGDDLVAAARAVLGLPVLAPTHL